MAEALVIGIDGPDGAVSRPSLGSSTESSNTTLWRRAHEELVRLARQRAGLDAEEGRWLLRALRARTHVELGYGSFYEYTERLFGYGPRLTQEKIRVAEALRALPETADALESGNISFSTARELTRVAVPPTERAWLEAAKGRTVREVEILVSGHRPGSLPEHLPDTGAMRHVLRFEVSGEVLATFREALAKLRRDAGEALDDGAALLLMSRYVLEGPRDEGRSSYQVALTVCEHCRRGRQQGRGELIEVSPEVVAMAECDAQDIRHIQSCVEAGAHADAHGATTRAKGACAHVDIHGATTRAKGARAHVDVRGATSRAKRACAHVDADEEATPTERARADVGADEQPTRAKQVDAHADAHGARTRASRADAHVDVHAAGTRAKQTIPPAIRREVLRRDGGRCRVPGCRHATFVDVHHLRPRAEGGENGSENLVTLCCAHHAAIHAGTLLIDGTASGALRFWHADGTPYGHSFAPDRVELRAKAYRTLVKLGFRASQTKRALARVPLELQTSVEALIRETLRELAPPP